LAVQFFDSSLVALGVLAVQFFDSMQMVGLARGSTHLTIDQSNRD
jgi:hypothetical protein